MIGAKTHGVAEALFLRTFSDRITAHTSGADTGYGSAEMLAWLVDERGIEPHIPVLDKSSRKDGTFSRDDFGYDHEADVYICPAGKTMTTTGTLTDGAALLYRASKQALGQKVEAIMTPSPVQRMWRWSGRPGCRCCKSHLTGQRLHAWVSTSPTFKMLSRSPSAVRKWARYSKGTAVSP